MKKDKLLKGLMFLSRITQYSWKGRNLSGDEMLKGQSKSKRLKEISKQQTLMTTMCSVYKDSEEEQLSLSEQTNKSGSSQLIAVPITRISLKSPRKEIAKIFTDIRKEIHKKKEDYKGSTLAKSTRRTRRKRLCWFDVSPADIFRPIKENIFFRLSGDIQIYIQKADEEQFPQYRTITEVEDNGWFLNLQCFSGECLIDFQFVIYLLEKSQCQQKYNVAQYLKGFQIVSYSIKAKIDELKNEYKNYQEEYENTIVARDKFKKQVIKNYIQNSLKSDEFFFIREQSANFRFHQLSAKQLFVSKSIFALIGLEEDQIATHLLHQGFVNQTLVSDRDMFFLAIMEAYSVNSNEFIRCKDFKIITLDGIHIHCDALLQPVYFEFPPDLHFKRSSVFPNDFESFIVLKYDITIEHMNLVLKLRNQMALADKDNMNEDFEDQVVKKLNTTLDYSFLASLFKDTFYPNEGEEGK